MMWESSWEKLENTWEMMVNKRERKVSRLVM